MLDNRQPARESGDVRSMQQFDKERAIASALQSLKTIIATVAGLSVATGIIGLLYENGLRGSNAPTLGDLVGVHLVFFALLILNLIRFHHGNIQLLDRRYSKGRVRFSAEGHNLALDFMVCFLLTVLLALMSFRLSDPHDFATLFVILLGVDVAWVLLAGLSIATADASDDFGWKLLAERLQTQWRWACNNIPALFLLGVLNPWRGEVSEVALAAIIGVNTVLDFALSWSDYFPTDSIDRRTHVGRCIFLAAPFTNWMQGADGLNSEKRGLLTRAIEALESSGHEVTSAHVREEWGRDLDPPAAALAMDTAAIEAADVLVAVMDGTPSPGLDMELGIALALEKEIVLARRAGAAAGYLIDGLPRVARCEVVEWRDEDDLVEKLGNWRGPAQIGRPRRGRRRSAR